MDEVWREVAGYEGLYEVSSAGRVRSVDRTILGRTGAKKFSGKELSLGKNPVSGYLQVGLYRTGQKKTHHVHVLVARAFVEGESAGHEVCHEDGVKHNNFASNLRWDTRSGNHGDKWNHQTMVHGEGHVNHRLTSGQVLLIRRSAATNGELAREFGVSPATITNITQRKTWRWLKEESCTTP